MRIPYYIAHSLIAFTIALPFALFGVFDWGLIAGMFFYVGREAAQYEEKKYFDWKGLSWPVFTNLLIGLAWNYSII